MSFIKQSETKLVCTLNGDFIHCQNSYLSFAFFGHFRLKPSSETQGTMRHVKLSPEKCRFVATSCPWDSEGSPVIKIPRKACNLLSQAKQFSEKCVMTSYLLGHFSGFLRVFFCANIGQNTPATTSTFFLFRGLSFLVLICMPSIII